MHFEKRPFLPILRVRFFVPDCAIQVVPERRIFSKGHAIRHFLKRKMRNEMCGRAADPAMSLAEMIHFAFRISRRVAKRGLRLILNNPLVNNLAILAGLDSALKNFQHPYLVYQPPRGKTMLEIAGYSNLPDIVGAVEMIHADLRRVVKMHPQFGEQRLRVLDIGCGPGLYLKDFDPQHTDVVGIDLNEQMCLIAQKAAPFAKVIRGDILRLLLEGSFDFIYAIGMLMYISRGELRPFFARVRSLLSEGGVFYLHYQHACSLSDLFCPDLTYVKYSPLKIDRLGRKYFGIVEHHHAYESRFVGRWDRTPKPPPHENARSNILNSSVMIARRRS